jgi:aspartyl-tRNA(Asn)/glutamyl-tRNA(Gln) amidotransferase subunit A
MSAALHTLTLVELADAIARGETTSRAATEASLTRFKTIGEKLNCAVLIEDDKALAAADKADAARKAGKPLGPLHGVPLAHKDLFYRAGRPSANGSKIRKDFVPQTTATVLHKLDAAGALDLGTLHMAEFAMSPTGYNEPYGHARNPWNTEHVPGGSSSGSGAAVAARIVSASLGTDTGGSLRHPAVMCGLTGLKPTWSRVSRANAMALSWSLDCVGPLARTARDCARVMKVISGADPADPTAARIAVPDYEAGLSGDLRGVTIAVPGNYYYDLVTPEIKAALDASLSALRDRGARTVATSVPDMALINALMVIVMTVEAAGMHRHWLATRADDYADQVRSRIEPGLYYPGTRYTEALSLRAKIAAEYVATAMQGADMLHLPTLSIPVPSIAETTAGDPTAVAAKIGAITHCTRGINYLGLPSLAVPCGFVGGLPAGFQLVGKPFSEALLLRTGDAYQRVTNWHDQAPSLAA